MSIELASPAFGFTQEQLDREHNGAFIQFDESVLDSTAMLGYKYLEEG